MVSYLRHILLKLVLIIIIRHFLILNLQIFWQILIKKLDLNRCIKVPQHYLILKIKYFFIITY